MAYPMLHDIPAPFMQRHRQAGCTPILPVVCSLARDADPCASQGKTEKHMNDLIIVGGGPAALAAAAYAMGTNLDFAIVMDEPGGWAGWRQTLTGQLGDEYLAGE